MAYHIIESHTIITRILCLHILNVVIVFSDEMPESHRIIYPAEGDKAIVNLDGIPRANVYSQGRMKTIKGASIRKRKKATILNDQAMDKYHRSSKVIDKERQLTDIQYQKNVEPLKKNLVDLRGTSVCLQQMRECLESTASPDDLRYGLYEGKTLRELKPTMNKLLQDNHPRIRKAQQLDRLLQNGEKDGRLVNSYKVMQKFSELLDKPFQPFPLRPKSYLTKRTKSQGKLQLPDINMGLRTLDMHDKGYNNFHISGGQVYIAL